MNHKRRAAWLALAHQKLDQAVITAYGFDHKADLLEHLLALNLDVANKIAANQPGPTPGLPATYPHLTRLITQDCLQPPKKGP